MSWAEAGRGQEAAWTSALVTRRAGNGGRDERRDELAWRGRAGSATRGGSRCSYRIYVRRYLCNLLYEGRRQEARSGARTVLGGSLA